MKPRNISLTTRPETFERNLEGAYDWDVTRPLAEQWPWSPAPVLTAEQKQAAADFDKLCDEGNERIIQGLRDMGSNDAPARPLGDPSWQDKVHEQTRHDVAASVARHAEIDPHDRVIRAGAPEVIGMTPRQVRAQLAEDREAEDELRRQCLADRKASEGSDPHSDFTERFKSEHDDSEPTQVGAVDARFDRTEVDP